MNRAATQLTDSLAALSEVLAALVDAPLADLLADLDPHASESALLSCITMGRQVAGLTAQLAYRVDAGGSWAEQGHRSLSAWLTARTTLSRGQAQDVTRSGDRASAHPVMAAAVSAGRVDPAHVKVVADAHRHYPRLSAALHGIEGDLADYAATTDPTTFASFLYDRLHRIDPDAVDDADAERLERDAFLTATSLTDGYVRVHGMLPPEIGTMLRAALDAGSRVPTAGTNGEPGTPTDPSPDTGPQPAQPSRRQRNLSALARILATAAATTGEHRLPDVRGARPVVHVQVHADTVEAWLTRAGRAVGAPGARLVGNPAPISADAAKRICCDAEIRRIVIDPGGVVLDVGRQTRVISPAQRVAITTRDQRCRFPGCREPIDDIHHIRHWADGGATESRNLLGACWFHHHEIHHGHWLLTGDANHRTHFTRRDGHGGPTWTSRPPRR